MKLIKIILPILGLCSCAHASEKAIIGDWIIADVNAEFSNKEYFVSDFKGKIIHISKSDVLDPLGGDCRDNASLDEIKSRPINALPHAVPLEGQWLMNDESIAEEIPSKDLYYGFITCEGMNFKEIALLNSNKIIYFYGDSDIFLLKRRE